MAVDYIKELDDYRGQACLVRKGDDYFVVSSVVALLTGFETLVFPADAEGNVTSWGEVAGGRGMSREAAIADLDGDVVEAESWDMPLELEAGE